MSTLPIWLVSQFSLWSLFSDTPHRMHASLLLGCHLERAINAFWKETLRRPGLSHVLFQADNVYKTIYREWILHFGTVIQKQHRNSVQSQTLIPLPGWHTLHSLYCATKPRCYCNQQSFFHVIWFTEKGSKTISCHRRGDPWSWKTPGHWSPFVLGKWRPQEPYPWQDQTSASQEVAGLADAAW